MRSWTRSGLLIAVTSVILMPLEAQQNSDSISGLLTAAERAAVADVRSVLDSERGSLALVALGSPAVPAMVAVLLGFDRASNATVTARSGAVVEGPARRCLLMALQQAPLRGALASFLRRIAQSDRGQPRDLLAVLRLVSDAGPSGSADVFLILIQRLELGYLHSRTVRGIAINALRRVVSDDWRSLSGMAHGWDELRPATRAFVLDILPELQVQRRRILDFVASRKDADELSIVAMLAALKRLAEQPIDLAEPVREHVRGLLMSDSIEVKTRAADVLGRIGDLPSVPALIPMLGAFERPVRCAALEALRRLSGERLPLNVGSWRRWHVEEETWHAEHSRAIARALSSEDPATLIKAFSTVCTHRLYRGEFLALILPHTSHREASVRRASCRTLQQLGHPGARAALIEALLDSDDAVRAFAHVGLQRITKVDLPPDHAAWRRLAEEREWQ